MAKAKRPSKLNPRNKHFASASIKGKPTKKATSIKPTKPKKKKISKKLSDKDFDWAVEMLGCENAAIRAVAEVESAGGGFQKDGQPKILFEGHIFWRRLKVRGINPYNHIKGNADVLHTKWTRKYYKMNQHKRLQKAVKINRQAALESASWGLFQIMGFNYKVCGYSTIQSFINAMFRSEGDHLKAFVGFVLSNHLDDEIREKKWANFARRYNGPGYKKNKYHTKMAAAYKKFKRQGY